MKTCLTKLIHYLVQLKCFREKTLVCGEENLVPAGTKQETACDWESNSPVYREVSVPEPNARGPGELGDFRLSTVICVKGKRTVRSKQLWKVTGTFPRQHALLEIPRSLSTLVLIDLFSLLSFM